jgi:hypothetical protein
MRNTQVKNEEGRRHPEGQVCLSQSVHHIPAIAAHHALKILGDDWHCCRVKVPGPDMKYLIEVITRTGAEISDILQPRDRFDGASDAAADQDLPVLRLSAQPRGAFSHDLLRRLGSEWEPPKRLPIAQQRQLRLRQLRRETSSRTTTRPDQGPHGTAD